MSTELVNGILIGEWVIIYSWIGGTILGDMADRRRRKRADAEAAEQRLLEDTEIKSELEKLAADWSNGQ